MDPLLFLAHRMPYPPNKGDKVRSYHFLKHLASRYRVFLGTFIDDPDDQRHVDAVRAFCAELHVERLDPGFARLRSLTGLAQGRALTLPYYRNRGLEAWVKRTVREQCIDAPLSQSRLVGSDAPRYDAQSACCALSAGSARAAGIFVRPRANSSVGP